MAVPIKRPALKFSSMPVVECDINTKPIAYAIVPAAITRAAPNLSAIMPVSGCEKP